jgi:alpha-ribazole phosphatase/probable phosphoglycerate mutase
MKTTRIYIIRHGQVVGHQELRYNGHFDVDITDEGLIQMHRLAELLKKEKIAAVYSSDLIRTIKGAEIISKDLNLTPVKLSAFKELHLGRWEGMTRKEAAKKYPEEAGFTFQDLANDKLQGGENLTELGVRVLPALEEIIERHSGQNVCLVLHGGVNRVILCDAMGLDIKHFFRIEQDYGCLNILDCFEDGIRVVKLLNGGPNQNMNPAMIY